jgi:beta-xylosidase
LNRVIARHVNDEKSMKRIYALLLSTVSLLAWGGEWIPDLANGRYRNPVLFADYSDPDVVRVGEDFYMVASSFNAMPGIPVLHSRDLVNWTIVGHVYDRLPSEKFDKPAHGQGSWAPSIRHHDGLFYVYFCTPHEGLFVATARDPAGPWTLEQMVAVELWEDPAPFWDDDGNAYLVRGKVRADILYLHRMSRDGKKLLDNGRIIYHNVQEQPTIEGPKMMKRDGYYYVLAPAGGVATGWQVALRAKNIYGPYEAKNVLHQGGTDINGPHQGGLIGLDSGEWWFLHFQDRDLYGRVVHLQPVEWRDGWPLMGRDLDNDGIGEPVAEWKKPDVGRTYPVATPRTSDEFDDDKLGLQWQWHANPQAGWYSLNRASPGQMRLYTVQNVTQSGNLHFVPNLLLQKFPAPGFSATTRITFHPSEINDKSGLVVMGQEWAYLALYKAGKGVRLGMFSGKYDREGDATVEIESVAAAASGKGRYTYYLRVTVEEGGGSRFFYSRDGRKFMPLGGDFQAKKGVWIGAKVGVFSLSPNVVASGGYADFDWFRID